LLLDFMLRRWQLHHLHYLRRLEKRLEHLPQLELMPQFMPFQQQIILLQHLDQLFVLLPKWLEQH